MKHELWYSERERGGVLMREGDASSVPRKWSDARVIWNVRTDDYALAAEICADVLRWGSRESSGPRATVRLTVASYLDGRGERCHVTLPGWVGRYPALLPGSEEVYVGLLDYLYLAVPDHCDILGYGYIERPGLVSFDGATLVIAAEKPEVLTVVTLRSRDAAEEMAQEFYERFQDGGEVTRMLGERLGAALSEWTIAQVQIIHLCTQSSS